jgi:hypothetical protein
VAKHCQLLDEWIRYGLDVRMARDARELMGQAKKHHPLLLCTAAALRPTLHCYGRCHFASVVAALRVPPVATAVASALAAVACSVLWL